jgi:hypothetical protein
MPRPTLDDIFAEPDEFGLLDIKLSANGGRTATDPTTINREIEAFRIKHGRLPDPEALDHEEMRLGTIRVRRLIPFDPAAHDVVRRGLPT